MWKLAAVVLLLCLAVTVMAGELRKDSFDLLGKERLRSGALLGCACGERCGCGDSCSCAYQPMLNRVTVGGKAVLYVNQRAPAGLSDGVFEVRKAFGLASGVYDCFLKDGVPYCSRRLSP